MIAALLSILGSSAVGSVLGGLFAFLNRRIDMDAKRLDLEQESRRWAHELQVKDKDLEYAKLEALGRKDVAIIEGEAAIESARFNAIAVSHEADKISADELKAAGKYKWVLIVATGFNKLIRPIATVLLTAVALYLNLILLHRLIDVWPTVSPDRQFEMSMQALAWVTGQAGAALGYFFVARGSSGPRP